MAFLKTALGIIHAFDVAAELIDKRESVTRERLPGAVPLRPTHSRLEEELRRRREAERRLEELENNPPPPPPPPQKKACPYACLGVTEDAPDYVVKAAYKAAARRAHPDHGGSDEEMSKLSQAHAAIARRRGWTTTS